MDIHDVEMKCQHDNHRMSMKSRLKQDMTLV